MEIEGIRGWGAAPGVVMVWDNELLVPSVVFGNVILAPQPPRGWELNEELLHANLSFPPTHQYLAFYYYLKDKFNADGIIHVGRHSTYEFLPRKSVGLSASDYPSLIIEGIPSIYPYIVDGVGEGIQAKRRGQAIMIDHLTPPLATTKLYDNLLELRQLIESAEAASDDNIRKNAINKIKTSIDEMNLRAELIESMDEELKVRGIGFDEVDDEFLLHEVGHYLTHLQEEFMPLGLHTFGQDWNNKAIDTMIESMSKDGVVSKQTKEDLLISPKKELESLVNALNGGYVKAGKGNDPIRTASALPTGRNFYALDGSLIPSTIGYEIGVKLAQDIRAKKEKNGNALKREIIKNILKDEIKLRLHKNIKKYTSLREELEKVIDRYHTNAIDSYATIAELVERAKDLQNDDKRTQELGLSEEELAFYDILAAKKDIIKEEGIIKDIVHAVVKAVKKNLQLDWTKKENAKASIRLAVKKELRGKVSITKLNEILLEIMEQAEGQFSDWSA